MRTRTISARYGSGTGPRTNWADVYVYPQRDGSAWYAIDGSVNVNLAPNEDELQDGVNVEEIADIDTSTAGSPIDSEEALEAHVDDTDEPEPDEEEEEPGMDEEDVRDAFWESHPVLRAQAEQRFGGFVMRQVRQNDHDATTRSAFVNFVDHLHRDGQISDNTANSVTL